ncbi:MAG: alanine--tRNA ligase, partial [Paludibacteraceae bacterium]|nr:alanine--tRNA ligase [Paludibacteraceae bacterium]
TGMGFERLCVAVQGKTSNYDTDVFQPLLAAVGNICSCSYGKDAQVDVAMRVVADHIRTISFAITDGQLPSNAKAGYVIRRILRRAVRYGYTFMNQREAFMYKLVPALIDNMGEAYPELKQQQTLIEKVIKEEEDAFLRTLETGIRLLDKVMREAKAAGSGQISGVDAFTLYDTYGFPLDLTELILKENALTLDHKEFEVEMQKQKDRARNAAAVDTGDWVVLKEGETEFVGYDQSECETEILRYRQLKQKNKTYYQLVLSKTPFYAEMGGQTGDTGVLVSANETVRIEDTKRENNLPVHLCASVPENPSAKFVAKIDVARRAATEANHSATHLLQAALREVLGTHVEQKGSFVSPDCLRFDFSHFQKLTPEELRTVERKVNAAIRANAPLDEHRDMPIAEAKKLGAMALFGEKYGDKVRVIKFGQSVELCGGTHVSATGRIGFLKIVSESSIAAGVRRIEAVTAEGAENLVEHLQDMNTNIRELFNNAPDLMVSVKKMMEDNSSLRKRIENFSQQRALQLREDLLNRAETVGDIKLVRLVGDENPEILKGIVPFFKEKFNDVKFALVVGTAYEEKPSLLVFLSQPLVDAGLNAGKMIREAAQLIQGGGGGQAFMATAGGKNVNGLSAAVDKLVSMIQ